MFCNLPKVVTKDAEVAVIKTKKVDPFNYFIHFVISTKDSFQVEGTTIEKPNLTNLFPCFDRKSS